MLTLCKACLRDFEGLPGWIPKIGGFLLPFFLLFFLKKDGVISPQEKTRESLDENLEESYFGELGSYNC